jgi:hypothetical protein
VAGSCEYGDEPSGSGATDLVKLVSLYMYIVRWANHAYVT